MPAFAPSPDVQQRRERLAAFMEAQVYPNERALAAEDDAAEALMRDLQGVKTTGVIAEPAGTGIIEIARPVGVVAAVVPSTNPGATPANTPATAVP